MVLRSTSADGFGGGLRELLDDAGELRSHRRRLGDVDDGAHELGGGGVGRDDRIDARGDKAIFRGRTAICVEHTEDDAASRLQPVDQPRREHAGDVVDHQDVEVDGDCIALSEHGSDDPHAAVIGHVVDQFGDP